MTKDITGYLLDGYLEGDLLLAVHCAVCWRPWAMRGTFLGEYAKAVTYHCFVSPSRDRERPWRRNENLSISA